MAWTTKSSESQRLSSVAKAASTEAMSSTSQGRTRSEPRDCGQRRHPLAERLALIGEGEFRPVLGQRLGDAPGDRVIVGDAHDEAALPLHQTRHASPLFVLRLLSGCGPRARKRRERCGRPAPQLQALEPPVERRCHERCVAFVPPKPNEFESTVSIRALSIRSRTMFMSATAGSSSSICALSQMKPLFIMSSE